MWSQILLCLLVGVAFASENPGWNDQHHYVYQVRGRSLASLNQISNDYSGIVFKAKLEVQPRSNGNLGARIFNAQYAKVHAELEDGWETYIRDSQLSYQQLPLSEKPFQIELSKGAVRNVIVSKEIKNWEANMIKSIVSQFQLDTQGTNLIPSSINILSQDDSNSAVFKTMEETVTGVAETLYEIHPYPEYVLQSKPWMVPQKHLNEQGEVIEIVKNKNFTHSEQAPSYHVGLEGIPGYKPGNKIGNFLSRTSLSQAIITGNLHKFTIQSSVTVEEIVLSPTLGDEQKGSVFSKLNITLLQVDQPSDSSKWEVSNPVSVGVVYSYGHPYESDNHPRSSKTYDHEADPSSAETSRRLPLRRRVRSFEYDNYSPDSIEEQDWHQEKPQMNEAPPSPLLPFTVGYDGQSYKKEQNIIETVRKLAQEIGQEFSHPKEIVRQQTPGKFITLASLVRIMDQNEIQKVASQLYSSQEEQAPAWVAFRDAVAQSGTGPALANIKEWIESDKISGHEAALIIATAADSARQPTEEYMRLFYDVVQDESIMSKPHLNQSALLSYTNLVYQVYVKRQDSHGKYPVYSYGSFRTPKGQEFVKKNVIPYLTRQLNEAINEADTRKIHVYIRALGNIGEKEILQAYEPYLEGEKKASHFQRVLMVTAMDKLVKSHPKEARSVLYKIYQNPSEAPQVRVAAVYQLMRTRPSASMLQRMASYTNVDPSSYVNAAVKSSIQSAAKLQSPEHYHLRDAAQSAESLLTSEEYGAQYSQGYLRSYVVEESELAYQQYVQSFAGKDHAMPKGIKYTLQKHFGGVKQNILNAQAMVSSVEDLLNVFQQQTKEYQRQQQEKQSQPAGPWSSEYVAQLLNLKNEQREQLEGYFYLQTGAFQHLFSFDNLTLENLPEEIRDLEQKLQQGKRYHYNKMIIAQESTLALPTALGLPFIYTYDRPALVKIEANVKANAQPSLSAGHNLQKPDAVEAEFDMNAVISGRVQTQLGFFTPFDHQRYSAGYNKNFQLVVPLNGKLELDVQKQQLKIEVQNPGNQESLRVAHYSTWPYTAQNEIFTVKPNLKIIRSEEPYKRSIVVGNKATGVAVSFQITSDERIDVASVFEKLRHHDVVSAFLNPWADENIRFVHVDIGIDSAKSTTQQVVLRLGYQYSYQSSSSSGQKSDPNEEIREIPSFSEDPEKRQEEFVERLARYLNQPNVLVGDATVEFQGQNKIKYSVTAGAVKSDVEPQSAFMALVRKFDKQNPQNLAYVQASSNVPNTNGLNLDYAMQMDPTSSAYVQVLLHNQQQQQSRVDAHIKLRKSEERIEYFKQQEEYRECKKQMQEGNQQLPICAKATARANLLDQFSIKMKYSNMDPRVINATYKSYGLLRYSLYPRIEENIIDPQTNDRLEIEGQFAPDLQSVNFSISSEFGQAEARNVEIGQWAQQLLVPHPVFHTKARLVAEVLKDDTYRPICVVDKTKTSTFDNKTYSSQLPTSWTVLLQYVPRRPSPVLNKPELSVTEQLHQDVESYVVVGRAPQQGSSQKEIQIVMQMPSTQGKIVKISLKPRQGKSPSVFVNEQEVNYNSERSSDFYKGQLQIYRLPNQEVKVEIRHAFYAIFDGETLKLTAVNSKFRDASRGLCGTFTGEPETDFLIPDNCIIQDPQQFIQSYTVQPQSRGYSMRSSPNDQNCYQKKVVFANYISNQDAGRSSEYERRGGDSCTGHLTRYVEKNGQICFSIRALPSCKNGCTEMGVNRKKIEVTCLTPTPTTTFWKSRLDSGINHDFTMMEATEKVSMDVPSRCVA